MFIRGYNFEQECFLLVTLAVVVLISLAYALIQFRRQKQIKIPRSFKPQPVQILFLILNIALIGAICLLVNDLFFQIPGVISEYPVEGQVLGSYDQPITVQFNRPINATIIKPYIHPEIKGEWKVTQAIPWLPFWGRELKFYPAETIFPGEKIFLYYAGIQNIIGTSVPWEFGVNAFSAAVPKLIETSPVDKSDEVKTDVSVSLKLSRNVEADSDWRVEVTPDTETAIEVSGDTLNIEFDTQLIQNTPYSLKIFLTALRRDLKTNQVVERGDENLFTTLTFKTVKAPLVDAFEPNGDEVLVNAPLIITFDKQMLPESVQKNLQFSPDTDGTYQWDQTNKILTFVHADFKKDTKYTLILSPGMESVGGGKTEAEIKFEFTTIGVVKVVEFSPGNGNTNVGLNGNVTVKFNQDVDHKSAQSKFSLNGSAGGSFAWSGNTMTFNPSAGFSYYADYTAKVDAGVKSINGVDSNTSFSAKFRTQEEVFTLKVPVYYQHYRFSCNLEATRMALAYRGVSISIDGLFNDIAKDNTPWDASTNTWGNPYNGYVGGYSGMVSGNPKGYGVYWGPVHNLISIWRSNTIHTGWNVTDMLKEVKNGNPVVIWSINGYSYSGPVFYWTTPDNQTIRAVEGMHSYVVVGYKGSVDNPTSIILNDPNRGRWTISTAYFNSLWGVFGNTGIVVY